MKNIGFGAMEVTKANEFIGSYRVGAPSAREHATIRFGLVAVSSLTNGNAIFYRSDTKHVKKHLSNDIVKNFESAIILPVLRDRVLFITILPQLFYMKKVGSRTRRHI